MVSKGSGPLWTRAEQIDKDGLSYPKGIEFTKGSGPTSGLEVYDLISFCLLLHLIDSGSKSFHLYPFRFIWKGTKYMTPEKVATDLIITVSLNRIWLIDEMNPGNDYYSSPDLYLGNQKAQKIEKFH